MTVAPDRDRLVRYAAAGGRWYGLERGDHFARLSAPPWHGGTPTGARDDLGSPRLAPCEPAKIVCIGLNYVEHVLESLTVAAARPGVPAGPPAPPESPMFFFKPSSAVLDPGGAIEKPAGLQRLDPEAEMALVIGRRARRVAEAEALAYVAGVTAFNDVSARDWQKSDSQWSRAKGCDTFAPFGPCIALGLDPRDLELSLVVNGETRQQTRTSRMHFGPARLIAWVSSFVTLEPGDVLATGTPGGIAAIEPGDTVSVTLEGVGTLTNRVVSAPA